MKSLRSKIYLFNKAKLQCSLRSSSSKLQKMFSICSFPLTANLFEHDRNFKNIFSERNCQCLYHLFCCTVLENNLQWRAERSPKNLIETLINYDSKGKTGFGIGSKILEFRWSLKIRSALVGHHTKQLDKVRLLQGEVVGLIEPVIFERCFRECTCTITKRIE